MSTLAEVTKTLGTLTAMIPHAPVLDDENFIAYHYILGDLDAETLHAAALEIGRSNTFFPAAAELRKAAFQLMRTADGVPNAQDAWAEVSKSFGSHGRYRGAPDWSHPAIAKAVEAVGGYATLCSSEFPAADRARFLQAFEAYIDRERYESEMLPQVREMLPRMRELMPRLGVGERRKELSG